MVCRVLVAIECRRCDEPFELCLCCYRGQAYCGDECRDQARKEQKRRARADYLRRLGQEAVRDDNRRRKRLSRHPEDQVGVTDHTAKARGEPVGMEQLDRGSQAANATAEQGSGRVLDEACEQASSTNPGPGVSRPADVPRAHDGAVLAALVAQELAAAPVGSDVAMATAEGGTDVVLGWQQQAPPGAMLGRCSCCGQPGWLVPWVLPAHAQQRSLRHLLATGGP